MGRGRLDNLIMLLSTDWFLGHWMDIDVNVDDRIQQQLQKDCRKIVKTIIGTASTYSGISHKPERLKKTGDELLEVLIKLDIPDSERQRFLELSGERDEYPMTSDFVMRFGALINLLISEGKEKIIEGFSAASAKIISSSWDETEPSDKNYEQLCLGSKSEWDNYMRQLTPDLPSRLSDFLRWELIEELRVKSFWKVLSTKCSAAERVSLLGWFERNSPSLLENEFSPPTWLK